MSSVRVVQGFAGVAAPASAVVQPVRRFNSLAIGLGVVVALGALALFAPQLGKVIAEDDAGARAFLRSEAARRPTYPAPVWRSVPAPTHASSYAPAQRAGGLPAPRAIDALLTPGFDMRKANAGKRAASKRKKSVAKLAPSAPASLIPVAAGGGIGRRSVCVRMCDGFYFPLGGARNETDLAGQAGMCGQLCPGAQTRLFVIPDGSEKIEDAVGRDGKKYSALPIAFRHMATRDPTCSCRRPGQETSATMRLLDDLTLRRGDGVMTEAGMRVFRGATRWPLRKRDFAKVGDMKLPRYARSALLQIDRAGRRPAPTGVLTPVAATPRTVPVVFRPGTLGKQVQLFSPVPAATLLR